MDTETLRNLRIEVFQKVKAGQFAEVLQLIKDVDVTNEFALSILMGVANACYNKHENSLRDSSNVDKDEVYNLLKNIIYSIDTVDGNKLDSYLQSVFHIIKYMCDEEWFEEIAKMEFIIVPTFLDNFSAKSTEEGKRVFKAIINKLCNSISRSGKGKPTIGKKCLLDVITIIFKANRQTGGCKGTLSLAWNGLHAFETLGCPINELCEFYFIVLDYFVMDLKKDENHKIDGVEILIHIFSLIISYIVEAKEFEVAETFLGNVETRIRLNFIEQEFVISHLMFMLITAMCPSNATKMQENMDSSKELIMEFKTCHKNILSNIISFLDIPIHALLSYYKSNCEIWYGLPSDIVFNMLKLVKDICCHLVLASAKCSCGCSLEKNYCGTLKIGCKFSGLLKHYLENNQNVPKRFYSEVEQWQIYLYEILIKVKTHNCKKWNQIYRELGTYTYHIATVLSCQDNVACVDVYRCFIRYSIEFEGFSPELLNQTVNEVAFYRICEVEDKNRNVGKSMTFAALCCFLYPLRCNSIFQNWWIRSKSKAKEDAAIQQQTLVSVLMKHGPALSSIVNVQNYLNKGKKVELLSYELLRYKTVWKSKESLMAAFSHLTEIADVTKISEIILEIFGDGDTPLHEKMYEIFSKTAKRIQDFLKTTPNHNLKMALAVLYYYNYKHTSKDTADKNLEEMDRTMQVMESAKENFEPIPKDPNDECDIVSVYSNLRLSKFTQDIKPLHRSVELIASCTTQSYKPQAIKNIPLLLRKIGLEYRLHCFSIKCIQAFELSLKFAQIISDNVAQLLAISFLIEKADSKTNFVMEMITKGDEIAKLLEKDNLNDIHSKTLTLYQISKARTFLYDDANLSYESWKIADALVTANESKDEFKILRADLYVLHYKLTKSCSFIAGEHDRNPMTLKLHCAFDIVINLTHRMMDPYELCSLFDMMYELTKVYFLMRLPRDLRAYSKNAVLLTQELVLPMRYVSFLMLLAHSDLLTCKFDHFKVKLNGMNDIFGLSQSRPIILSERIELENSDVKIIENEIDECTSQIQEMTLDLPQHTRQYSPSSPSLVVESFKAPQFLSHEKNCMCFICLSFEYQQLLLQKYHLDALFNMYDNDEKMAEEFIHGALMLYKTVRRNYDCYRKKAKNLISESLIFNFDDSFREYYGNILYDYSFYLMRKSQRSEALKTNTELVQLIGPKKFQYVYLYHNALLQRLSYVIPEPIRKSCPIEIEDKLMTLRLTPNDHISLPKTPTNKKSTVTVTVNGFSEYHQVSPKRRIRKKCALFNSPVDNDEADRKSTQTQKGTTPKHKITKKTESESTFALPKTKDKKRNIPGPSTPLLIAPQTPKINIFMDEGPIASVRKSRRKQPSSAKKQLSMDTIEAKESLELINSAKKSTKSIRKTLNSAMILEDNIDGSKKNVKDCDNNYCLPVISGQSKARSQLLTKKIKASTQQSKTCSSTLRTRLVGGLLVDKISVPVIEETGSSSTEKSESSSVILESPENEIANTKLKTVLKKGGLSAKKINDIENRTRVGPGVKKNLLSDFLDNEVGVSSSKCTKHTGAIRKSTRNRVL